MSLLYYRRKDRNEGMKGEKGLNTINVIQGMVSTFAIDIC